MRFLPGTTGRRRIYLMRHGHVDYFGKGTARPGGVHEVHLTELGQRQADAAGAALAEIPFDRAVCSSYPRTQQTAERVLAHLHHPAPVLEVNPALREVQGGVTQPGLKRDQLAALLAFAFDRAAEPEACMGEGGERFDHALARATAAIEGYLHEPDWHTMLIVAHEGINRLLLSWCTGAGLKAVSCFEQDLACINILDFDLVPRAEGEGVEIQRRMIKAVNLTPYNLNKFGMNLTSLETIFARAPIDFAR